MNARTNDNAGINDQTVKFRVVHSAPVPDDDTLAADEREIAERPITPTEKDILTKARRRQGVFWPKVLQIEPRCRLTGTMDPRHLRASHIKPWAGASDKERLDGCNGLMLAPHVDHLFDRAFISFTDDGELLVLNDQVHLLLDTWAWAPASETRCRVRSCHVNRHT